MEIHVFIPIETEHGLELAAHLQSKWPDSHEDSWEPTEGIDIYLGKSSEDWWHVEQAEGPIPEDDQWLNERDAIWHCGYAEGLIPQCETCIEDNGAWAMGMLREHDFSGYVTDEKTKAGWKADHRIWKAGFLRGQRARAKLISRKP